ncbi:coiled-coil protein [Legionella birminghamensis]|uniref:Coiled-coil protein n=1 Tax=Legionella birminghamensis TaxID=28083 RepID=A0A378I993_9GAMM|nr:hypothetical protein [Legionella birminghamensis]KTC68099.1 coiled-coil protein [Legionella birminghamensis]STX31191.1 coiled-coil protein [Legionella birminghamensis]
MYTKKEVINGLPATITKTSIYPIPWTGNKTDRPKDYFEQIETRIQYKENERDIEIIIPKVSTAAENRTRKLSVKVDGKDYPFNKEGAAVLDMAQTFDLPEMDKLLGLVNTSVAPPENDSTLRASLPFFYIPDANYELPEEKARLIGSGDGELLRTHGDIEKLVLPYLNAMKYHPGQRKEVYIPVVTLGIPHHWNVCILTIDEANKPSLTYLESTANPTSELYLNFYKHNILPGVNHALKKNGYETIDENDIIIDASKQFSQDGCGIAASLNIQNLLNGSLKVNGTSAGPTEDKRITMEEDAVRRVQLGIKLTRHGEFIAQWRDAFPEHQEMNDATRYKQEGVLRELTTHPLILKQKAKETFPDVAADAKLEIDLEIYRKNFDSLLLKLKDTRDLLLARAEKNDKYKPVASQISALCTVLEDEMGDFFKNPSAEKFQESHTLCNKAIQAAEKESAHHRGWHTVHPIVRGIAGVLAAISIIPALIVSFKSDNGYRKTFFDEPQTATSRKFQVFKTAFEEMKQDFETSENEVSEAINKSNP